MIDAQNQPFLPWDRAGRLSLALNIAIPLALCLLTNWIIFSTGMNTDDNATTRPWFAPPGWAVGSIWVGLYILYGAARWRVITDAPDITRARGWITFLVFWGISYPFITLGFDIWLGAMMNVVSLLFTIIALMIVHKASRHATLLLIPSALWESFAVFLGFATLNGWGT